MSAIVNSIDEERWLNPDVLKWAREWRGRTLEEAAKEAGQKGTRVIKEWESGARVPTVNQARTLARFYSRPFLELLLPHPPQLAEPVSLPDFRMQKETQPPSEDWEFKEILNWAAAQRVNALDLFEEIRDQPNRFPKQLIASLSDSPEDRASQARDALDFPIEHQVDLTQSEAAKLPALIRGLFESVGVLTLRHSGLGKVRARGLCIAEFPLPTIVFSSEAASAQTFTLVHEFGHILLRQSAITGNIDRSAKVGSVEGWCNRFTAAFLMPAAYLRQIAGDPPPSPALTISDEQLARLSKHLRVSPHAMLIRLVHLAYVHPDYYWNVKKAEFELQEQKRAGGGRAPYYGIRYRTRQGDLYTGLVLEAWSSGRITNHNAAEFMGIKKLEHLEAIRDHFGQS